MNRNIDEEIQKHKGFFDTFKTSSSLVLGGAVLGTATGAVLNGTKPEMLPNYIGDNGKQFISDQIDNKGIPFGGKISGIVNSYLDNNILNKTLPINLITGGLAGVAVGTVGAAATSLYNIVKNGVSRVSSGIKNKKFMDADNEFYREDNLEEARLIAQRLKEETGKEIEGFSYNTL